MHLMSKGRNLLAVLVAQMVYLLFIETRKPFGFLCNQLISCSIERQLHSISITHGSSCGIQLQYVLVESHAQTVTLHSGHMVISLSHGVVWILMDLSG